jgi:hypothetical protein
MRNHTTYQTQKTSWYAVMHKQITIWVHPDIFGKIGVLQGDPLIPVLFSTVALSTVQVMQEESRPSRVVKTQQNFMGREIFVQPWNNAFSYASRAYSICKENWTSHTSNSNHLLIRVPNILPHIHPIHWLCCCSFHGLLIHFCSQYYYLRCICKLVTCNNWIHVFPSTWTLIALDGFS